MSNQEQDKQAILSAVAEYFEKYHNVKKDFTEGQRIPYASRVYDSNEAVNLVDSALEFWLTAGRYTDEFEKKLEYARANTSLGENPDYKAINEFVMSVNERVVKGEI